MKYRSRTEIMAIMLGSLASGPQTGTKIMYKAYISYAQLQEYLLYLQDSVLISYERGTQHYKITEKGLMFLHKYNDMCELIPLRSI